MASGVRPQSRPDAGPTRSKQRGIRQFFQAARRVGSALIVSVGIASGVSVATASADPLRLSTANLAPVVTTAGDGYLDRIVNRLFRNAGVGYEVKRIPARRGLVEANDGYLDGDMGRVAGVAEEFRNLVAVPEPVITVAFAGLFLRDDIQIRTAEDFAGYRIGYIRGWSLAQDMFAENDGVQVVRNAETLMTMLAQDRIDVAFMTIAPALHIADRLGLNGVSVTEWRLKRDLFLYLHRRHAELVPVLRDLLLAMKADGSYDAILTGYAPEG